MEESNDLGRAEAVEAALVHNGPNVAWFILVVVLPGALLFELDNSVVGGVDMARERG